MFRLFYKGGIFTLAIMGIYMLLLTAIYITPPYGWALHQMIPILRPKGDSQAYYSFKEFEEQKKIQKFDFVVLGSSQAYRGYDPRIFKERGYHIHNLGTSSQRFWHTRLIARDLIDTAVTKAVILDIYRGGLNGHYLEPIIDLVQHVPSQKLAAEFALKSEDIRAMNLLGRRLLDDIFQPDLDKTFWTHSYIAGGFSSRSDSTKVVKNQKSSYKRNNPNLKHINELLKDLHKKELKVLFVMSALPSGLLARNKKDFLEDIKQIAKQYDNVQVTDLAWSLGLNNHHHFFDHRHLNQSGVNIFNEALLDYIDKNQWLQQ